jgi:drug/metabolite transporter (DMT)-like permease
VPALLVLLAVTAVWGVTFVQVKDAVAVYPLFAFLALRFAIAGGALAVPGAARLRSLGRAGVLSGILAGALLGAGYAFSSRPRAWRCSPGSTGARCSATCSCSPGPPSTRSRSS